MKPQPKNTKNENKNLVNKEYVKQIFDSVNNNDNNQIDIVNQDFFYKNDNTILGKSQNESLESNDLIKDKKKKYPQSKKSKPSVRWPIIALITTFCLSFTFSFGSQFLLSNTGIVVSIILLIFFLALATITDMIGVAVASSDAEPFNAMCARKVNGAKESLTLIKHADRVSSIFCDIIGDICGILSGSIGAVFTLHIVGTTITGIYSVLIASVVSAFIAALTVFLKALGKKIAMNHSTKIIFTLGKIMHFFKFKKK